LTNLLPQFGVWYPIFLIATSEWGNGDGSLPNAQDFGVMVMADKAGQAIADAVANGSHFGAAIGFMPPQNVVVFGYPTAIDGGLQMQQLFVQSQARNATPNQTFPTQAIVGEFGNGAAGGPWVLDFGFAGMGQVTTSPGNQLIGVTSFFDPGTGWIYSSIAGAGYKQIIDAACNERAGNCN
jgi:hypothetical protein